MTIMLNLQMAKSFDIVMLSDVPEVGRGLITTDILVFGGLESATDHVSKPVGEEVPAVEAFPGANPPAADHGFPADEDTMEGPEMQQQITEPLVTQALHLFLSDTVMHCPGASIAQGHFLGLSTLLQLSTRTDPLPLALEAVALASLAARFYVPKAQLLAAHRSTMAIRYLRDAVSKPETKASSLVASVLLLSLYEIVNADSDNALNWLQHVHGLIAVTRNFVVRKELPATGIPALVLGSETPPYCEETDEIDQSKTSPLTTVPSQPITCQFSDLCSILPKVHDLFKKSAFVFQPNAIRYESILKRLQDEASNMKNQLSAWASSQPEEIRYETIEHFTRPYVLRFPGLEDLLCPITRADIYCDYLVACMWTSYRQCQLHLTDLLNRINHSLSGNPEKYAAGREHARLRTEIQTFVGGVFASMPFMLAGEMIRGTKPWGQVWFQARPPMLVGGLNLMWVLFTIATLDIVPPPAKQNAKASLRWIGKNLGIGKATVLAHMERNGPGGITAKGDALRWVGFLV